MSGRRFMGGGGNIGSGGGRLRASIAKSDKPLLPNPKQLQEAALSFFKKQQKMKEDEEIQKVQEQARKERELAFEATKVFSDKLSDSERIKMRNLAQSKVNAKRPLNSLVQIVLSYLRDERRVVSTKEILEAVQVNLDNHEELRNALKDTEKVLFQDEKNLVYRPTHGSVHGVDDLKVLIDKNIFGISFDELTDAYPGVLNDIECMIEREEVISIVSALNKVPMIYPKTGDIPSIDPDILEMWEAVQVPRDPSSLSKELVSLGLKSAEAALKSEQLESDWRLGLKRAADGEIQARPKKRRRSTVRRSNLHLNDDLTPKTSEQLKEDAAQRQREAYIASRGGISLIGTDAKSGKHQITATELAIKSGILKPPGQRNDLESNNS